ncbi:hydrogen peroxide-inducible genes activator [Sphingomonas sp. G124]|uniref:Hydrogen peroxide-inducible genes activator n=1 Tax=Sphingomonas cremea TaxID=2904799 RepID=A0A9X1QKC9_9SPHN|nr:hydrogen peroxide-inducible genes activator [Sphingomonas cremea]MCF2514670.1 hydrogen peroxide-inducible genes activator [Sphingomonas cremea]
MTAYLPTIKQLQYLVALRQHGHFGKAAEASFVTQSTLSAGLRELETLLGVTLVERTRRVVRFTPLGLKVSDKAVRVLRECEELADIARAEGQPLHGELRMGVIPTIAPFLLPAMLPRLRNQWPSLKLYLREETSQAACDALHRGQLDCVLLAMPYACGEVDKANLFDDRLFVAFPRGEAPDEAAVDPGTIDENRLLLLEDGHCLKDHALSACNRPELRAEAAIMGTSLHTLVQMVDNGLGLTFVPAMAIDAGILEGTGVDVRPLKSDHGFRRIALVWRRSSPREVEFQMLAETLRQIAASVIRIPATGKPASPGAAAPQVTPALAESGSA